MEKIDGMDSLLNLLLDELNITHELLGKELVLAEISGDMSRINALIRIRIRLFVSLLEAACFHFRQVAHDLCVVSKKEIPPTYRDLDNRKRIDAKDKIKLSLHYLAYSTGESIEIDTTSSGWQKVCILLNKRHHFTHPNKVNDLQVSVEDLENVNEAIFWFLKFIYRFIGKECPHYEEPSADDIEALKSRFRKAET